MEKKKIISLVGAPASGKGYLVDCIVDELVLSYQYKREEIQIVSIGEMIRKEIKSGSKLGETIKASKKPGCLAPDDLITAMMKSQLNRSDAKITIIDGYPRTLNQVKSFNELEKGNDVSVVFRDTPVGLISDRVNSRRVCAVCGASHIVTNGACDCGGKLVKRPEDEHLSDRMEEYIRETKPAIDWMNETMNCFHRVDGRIEGNISAKKVLNKIIPKQDTLSIYNRIHNKSL